MSSWVFGANTLQKGMESVFLVWDLRKLSGHCMFKGYKVVRYNFVVTPHN